MTAGFVENVIHSSKADDWGGDDDEEEWKGYRRIAHRATRHRDAGGDKRQPCQDLAKSERDFQMTAGLT